MTPDVLTQMVHDVGEISILSRASGVPTLTVGIGCSAEEPSARPNLPHGINSLNQHLGRLHNDRKALTERRGSGEILFFGDMGKFPSRLHPRLASVTGVPAAQ